MIIALPLSRFVFAGITVLAGRWSKQLLLAAHLLDLGLILALILTGATAGSPVTLGGWGSGIGITLAFDDVSMTFLLLALTLSIAISLYVWSDGHRPHFYVLLHFLIGACYALSATQDLFNAYILFELLTLVSFLLVGYERRPKQIWASLRYMIMSSFGMGLFLLGVAVVYYHTRTLNIDHLMAAVAGQLDASWVRLAAALLVAGIAVKAGVFTFSLWLPDAHSRAVPAVSALLSGLVIKMGVVELFRLGDIFPLDLVYTVLGVTTGLIGALYAIRSMDLKRMLAFSTLSQIGYILIALGAGSPAARLGALDYAVAHGLFKALLFLAIGEIARRVGSSNVHRMLASGIQVPRAARWAILFGLLSIVGLPPFAGFAAKGVIESSLHSGLMHGLLVVISVGTAMSFAKFLPLLRAVCTSCTPRSRTMSYIWLSTGIASFLPLALWGTPATMTIVLGQWPVYVEALLAAALGFGLFRFVQGRKLVLPSRVFRLEEGVLVIVAGFFAVWLLYGLG